MRKTVWKNNVYSFRMQRKFYSLKEIGLPNSLKISTPVTKTKSSRELT